MILALLGPTGIGKSEVALSVAQRIPSEIVSVDSMQVYRGMCIGTGKPPLAVREKIPHHGLDLVEPEEEFDVARYVAAVRPAVEGILARGLTAVLAGGSGLYLRGLLEGICPAPGKDRSIRDRLLAEAHENGLGALYARLQTVDPEAAARIHPNDLRKMCRALEVYQASGRPLSDWQKETVSPFEAGHELLLVGLTCSRKFLYQRIEERIDGWIAQGWLEEARVLCKRPLSQTARGALGYRELFAHLSGQTDWDTTVSLIKQNTRRYAKRQWTWFRADSRIQWISVDDSAPQTVAETILEQVRCLTPQ